MLLHQKFNASTWLVHYAFYHSIFDGFFWSWEEPWRRENTNLNFVIVGINKQNVYMQTFFLFVLGNKCKSRACFKIQTRCIKAKILKRFEFDKADELFCLWNFKNHLFAFSQLNLYYEFLLSNIVHDAGKRTNVPLRNRQSFCFTLLASTHVNLFNFLCFKLYFRNNFAESDGL